MAPAHAWRVADARIGSHLLSHDRMRAARPESTNQWWLSRLNHRLPRGQAHPDIMQGTASFQHQIADARLPQAAPVLHDPAARDTALDMLDAQPPLVACLVRLFLLPRELRAAWLRGRHEGLRRKVAEPLQRRSPWCHLHRVPTQQEAVAPR